MGPDDIPVMKGCFYPVVVQGSGANQHHIARLDDDLTTQITDATMSVNGDFQQPILRALWSPCEVPLTLLKVVGREVNEWKWWGLSRQLHETIV